MAPYLEQLATVSGASRDPRGWSASVVYYALVNAETLRSRGREAHTLLDVSSVAGAQLAFDHAQIIEQAVTRLRNKAAYSALPCYLLPEQFTLAELQRTYEQVLGEGLDKSSFRRKLAALAFLEEVPGVSQGGQHRPAQLYRLRQPATLAIFDRTL